MTVRRWLGACLLLTFLAPLARLPLDFESGTGFHRIDAGAACCGAMACCDSKGVCGSGACNHASGRHAAESPSSAGSRLFRLGANCPGPAPAATPQDLGPMLLARAHAAPIPAPVAELVAIALAAATSRATTPTVPPPRA